MKDVIKYIIAIFIAATIGYFYGWYDHDEYSNKPLIVNERTANVDKQLCD